MHRNCHKRSHNAACALPSIISLLHGLKPRGSEFMTQSNQAWRKYIQYPGSFPPARRVQAFYADFVRVADDESRHLGWLLQRLAELGHAYGDLPAHDLLWEGAAASTADVTARLAVVPMSQEARGLDAGPRLADRLNGMGDPRSARIVKRIAAEERAHVAVGVAWFKRVRG